MKKLMILGIGLFIVGATAVSVFAATDATASTKNANCNVSIESKQETLKQYVTDGKITQEKSDKILKQLENCDGTGTAKIGQNNDVSFGGGKGERKGEGKGQGKGMRNGEGTNCSGENCTVTE